MDMDILNAEFDFSSASPDDQAAFPGRRADKVRIPANSQLYKFTQYLSLQGPNGVTPWWSSVKPAFGNVGLRETLKRAGRLDVDRGFLSTNLIGLAEFVDQQTAISTHELAHVAR